MQFGRLGVWCSTDRLDAAALRALLHRVEDHGYGSFWYPESRGYESMALAGFLLANSKKRIGGSSIANIHARDAFTATRGLPPPHAFPCRHWPRGLGISPIQALSLLRSYRAR